MAVIGTVSSGEGSLMSEPKDADRANTGLKSCGCKVLKHLPLN